MEPAWILTKSDEKKQKAVFKSESVQQKLNKPLKKEEGLSPEDREFMGLILGLIEEGKIEEYKPESLINKAVYDGLSEDQKGKVDFEALNLLSVIRNIKYLHDAGFGDSYELENMVATLRATKERLEEGGDLFII